MPEESYMRRAIQLAWLGCGFTDPNPMVGAVIVKEGRIIGEGYHRRCGDLHAERVAIASLKEAATGATLYVTLEPCCHYGRTPPCTEAILEQGISRVVIGSRDPNPLVAGKGVEVLRTHGVEVIEDYLRQECDAINPVFFHYITHHTPYVVMKFAQTLDGKIASRTGASKWITGEVARKHVHGLRGRYSSILVGIGTVLKDDPLLNCRLPGAHQPLRIVVDSSLRIPLESKLVKTAREYPTLVAAARPNPTKEVALKEQGVEVLYMPDEGCRVDVQALLKELGRRQVSSVLVEGGAEIHEAVLRSGLVCHVMAYIAPLLMGGRDAKTSVGGIGFDSPDMALHLTNQKVTQLGPDLLLEYDAL